MNRNQALRWLFAELPTLVERGVLSDETANSIRAHYGEPETTSGRNTGVIIFAILGALLIGSGVIALIAANWKALPDVARLVIGYVPVLIAGWMLLRQDALKPESLPWREGLALVFNLLLGAAIGITAETFEWHSRSSNLILLWLLLSLPAIYIAQAAAPAILYFGQIIWWSVDMQSHHSYAISYWMLLMLIAPYVVGMVWKKQHGARATSLLWALTACLTIGVGVTLERVVPGLWIIIYTALFAAFLLCDEVFLRSNSTTLSQRPLRVFGVVGTLVMALILSFQGPWRSIGWANYRTTLPGFNAVAAINDYVLVAVLPALAFFLIYKARKMISLSTLIFAVAPAIALITFPAASYLYGYDYREPIFNLTFVYNVYALALGIALISRGIKNSELAPANIGLAYVSLLALVRFFDDDIPLLVKGGVFIAIGVGFLAVNVVLTRQGKKPIISPKDNS